MWSEHSITYCSCYNSNIIYVTCAIPCECEFWDFYGLARCCRVRNCNSYTRRVVHSSHIMVVCLWMIRLAFSQTPMAVPLYSSLAVLKDHHIMVGFVVICDHCFLALTSFLPSAFVKEAVYLSPTFEGVNSLPDLGVLMPISKLVNKLDFDIQTFVVIQRYQIGFTKVYLPYHHSLEAF